MIEEGDIVLCTVERISGTTVFVKIEDKDGAEGTIITSEIAPGRIRNLRDYVVPNKKIICKILSINNTGSIHLSLRRVTEEQRKQIRERYKREKNALSILKTVAEGKIGKIVEYAKKQNIQVYDFLQECKDSPDKLEGFLTKEEAEKLCKILNEKKAKQIEVKKQFSLTTKNPEGLILIKNILKPHKTVFYLAAGRYVIKEKADNYKQANTEVNQILQDIEKQAEQNKVDFKVKEKKK